MLVDRLCPVGSRGRLREPEADSQPTSASSGRAVPQMAQCVLAASLMKVHAPQDHPSAGKLSSGAGAAALEPLAVSGVASSPLSPYR